MRLLKKTGLMIVAILLCMTTLVQQVKAIDRMDETKTGSLTLHYPVEDITFSLYKVGEIGGFGEITLTDAFKEYPITVDEANWEEMALTVAGYIDKDQIPATVQADSTKEGTVVFENLELGLYLVKWDSHKTHGTYYISSPYFVCVPSLDEEDNWVYDLDSNTKYRTEEYEMIDLHVHKVWDDRQDEAKKRPASITVELLENGEAADTVTLNAENGWSHDWKELDAGETWRVVEKEVPEGYTVSVSQEGSTILVKNTLPETPPSTPPTTPPTPPEKPKKPELPYTGILWWPVPMLGIGGLFLVMGGTLLRRSGKE